MNFSAHDSRKLRRLLTPVACTPDHLEVESLAHRLRLPMQRHLDSDEQLKVVDAYQKDKAVNDVARWFGLHCTTVLKTPSSPDLPARLRALVDKVGEVLRDDTCTL